jgi:hypothetical protein
VITQEEYYGGAIEAGSNLSIGLPVRGGRFVRATGSLPVDRVYTLPNAIDISEGGPVFVISNGNDTATVDVKRSDNVSIGTISAGSTGYVFLTDRYSNLGAGTWYLAGTGTSGEVGDQADPAGFFYGRAVVVNGLETDLQTATNTPDQAHGVTMDFGSAVISVPPSIII